MKRNLTYGAFAAATAALFVLANACGGGESSTGDGGSGAGETTTGTGGTGATGSTGGSTSTGDGGGFVTVGSGGNGSGGNCVDIPIEATQAQRPADIIFVIDNSGSMSEEIASVEANIDVNFAQIMAASNVDYQVVMVTNHGTGTYDVCIGPPLSGTTNCAQAPVEIPGQFYHYDVDVQSWDSVCILLDTLFGPQGGGEADAWGLHPNGWVQVLRQNAIKTFVEITDDRMSCTWNGHTMDDQGTSSPAGQTAAVEFDQTLLGLAPFQFGTVANRNYLWYSIVGMTANVNPLDPYDQYDPVVTTTCSGGVSPGTGYQWLSKGTGVLRFPVCQYQSYDSVFNDIAAGVVEGTALPCTVQLPSDIQDLNYESLVVNYTPGGGGMTEEWTQVPSEGACGLTDNTFWVDQVTNELNLCPEACDRVTADTGEATLDVEAQCVPDVN
ncbi:MAG: hypothetical protein R3B72_41940 [Polyangiaceae bacterium]